MWSKTDDIPENDAEPARLDERDRMLLTYLYEDASVSYARLGELVALSPAAVHQRVKRLRRDGVISGNSVRLNPDTLGRRLLAFISIDARAWSARSKFFQLSNHADIEEIHSVAGDYCLLLKVRCRNTAELENLIEEIHTTGAVGNTKTTIVLSTYHERGPLP